MRNNKKPIIIWCIGSLLLAGCMQQDTDADYVSTDLTTEDITEESAEQVETEKQTQSQETETGKMTEEETEARRILSFLDINGEPHEVEVKETWKMHSYDWEKLIMDGAYKYYSDGENGDVVSRMGIDVSEYQGIIDWEQVADSGISFAFIRVGYRGYGAEGRIGLDERFHENIVQAAEQGLDIGVYFFSQAVNEQEAAEEADFVLEQIEAYELDLPVVFDPEEIKDATARTDDVSPEQFTANSRTFCEKIKDAGYEPAIYCNMVWQAFVLDLAELEAYLIWYADHEAVPQTPYQFQYWQYSDEGYIDGIEGPVDLNIEMP